MKRALCSRIALTLSLLALALGLAVSRPAEAQPADQDQYFTSVQPVQANQSYGTCYALTQCPNGNTIWCQVQGNAAGGVACSWLVVPGVAVECRGYVFAYGAWMWQVFHFNC